MSDVIKADNLSKKYIIGHQKQERYTALMDVMANSVKRLCLSSDTESSSQHPVLSILYPFANDIMKLSRKRT